MLHSWLGVPSTIYGGSESFHKRSTAVKLVASLEIIPKWGGTLCLGKISFTRQELAQRSEVCISHESRREFKAFLPLTPLSKNKACQYHSCRFGTQTTEMKKREKLRTVNKGTFCDQPRGRRSKSEQTAIYTADLIWRHPPHTL